MSSKKPKRNEDVPPGDEIPRGSPDEDTNEKLLEEEKGMWHCTRCNTTTKIFYFCPDALDSVKLCVTAEDAKDRKAHAKTAIDFLNDKEPASHDFNAKMFAAVVQSISTLAEFVAEIQESDGKVIILIAFN